MDGETPPGWRSPPLLGLGLLALLSAARAAVELVVVGASEQGVAAALRRTAVGWWLAFLTGGRPGSVTATSFVVLGVDVGSHGPNLHLSDDTATLAERLGELYRRYLAYSWR